MRNMRRQTLYSLSLVIGVASLVSGCASFPKHRLPEAGKLVPPIDQTRAVSTSYEFKFRVAVGPMTEAPQQARDLLEKEFVDTLKESGYFIPLRSGKGESVHIDALVENYGNIGVAIAGGVISGLSLTIIPVWVSDGFRAKVTVTTKEGVTKQYALDDAMTTVFWLPLIVATPFKGPGRVSEHVRKNMYKTLIQKMQADGILPPAKAGIQTSYLIRLELAPAA